MKVLIVDDDLVFSEKIKNDLKELSNSLDLNMTFDIINRHFLSENYGYYSLAFIDIDLKTINGIVLAKKLKKSNSNLNIIFVSAKNNLIHNSLSVQPFFFIRKSDYITDFQFFKILLKEELTSSNYIMINYKGKSMLLSLKDILYVEANLHYIDLYTLNGSENDDRTLNSLEEIFPKKEFIRVHRSYIINLSYVHHVKGNSIYLTTSKEEKYTKIPLSRTYKKTLFRKI